MGMNVDVKATGDITALPGGPTRRRRVGEDWRVDAVCTRIDPEVFFPEAGDNAVLAKNMCLALCPVQEECLAYALERHERFGIWGGMSTPERDRHARRLARRTAAGVV